MEWAGTDWGKTDLLADLYVCEHLEEVTDILEMKEGLQL